MSDQNQQQNQQQAQGQQTQGQQTADQNQPGAKPLVFDTWLTEQDEPVKAVINTRFQALENTVKATRDERDAIKVQVKDLLTKAEKGSALEKSLNETMAKLDATEKRAAFFEDAVKPGIDCRNPKAAFALAMAENLFDRKGIPDWATLKTEAPELFGKVVINANAGEGSGNKLKNSDMNMIIRRAAGRQ